MVTIPSLTPITDAGTTDEFIIETAGGTRRITRTDLQIRHAELGVLTSANINVLTDRVWIADATDGRLKGVTVFDLIFGNFTNLQLDDGFALDPAVHNIRPLQLNGTFNTPIITLSDQTANIGGATFNLFNFSTSAITLSAADDMTIFSNGSSVASVSIRENTGATVQVRDNGEEAIFAGG